MVQTSKDKIIAAPPLITEALRERFARLQDRQKRASPEELLSLADRIAADFKRPYPDHAKLLYDEDGLPT